MPLQKIINLKFLIIGILFGVCGHMLFGAFMQRRPDKDNKIISGVNPVAGQMAAIADILYQEKTASAKQSAKALQQRYAQVDSSLTVSKSKTGKLQRRAKALILSNAAIHETMRPDTTTLLSNCDSLGMTVDSLLTESAEKDSLYDEAIGLWERQLTNRDSTIDLLAEQNTSLRLSYHALETQQQILTDQCTLFRKQVATQKIKSKLLSTGAVILTGIVTYGLLRH